MKINQKLKVSVIIPAYNAADYIKETMDSVLNQSWKNLEVFIIDDGSSDNTLEIAQKYKSENVKIISQANSGACVARNKGLALSSGDYIQYLDADDVLSLDKIEKQMEVLNGRQELLAVCNTIHFTDGDDYKQLSLTDESKWIYNNDDPVEFLVRLFGGYGKRWMVQTSSWLTPRQIAGNIGPWDESLLLDQDGEYFTRAVLESKGIRTSGGINYYRRFVRGSNISEKAFKYDNLKSALKSLKLKSSYLGEHTQSAAYQKAMATLFTEIAINAYPRYKDIVHECEVYTENTRKKPDIPVLGGTIIELINKTAGWKTAKMISYLIHKKRKQ